MERRTRRPRPDSTVPVARAALENDIAIPARLFYVQNRFRFTDGDDDREDWQCGIEYLGAPDFLGELEAASVACETLRSLGMEPSLRLAHVGIARALIDAAASLQGADRAALRDRVAEEGLGALRADLDGRPRLTAFLRCGTPACLVVRPAG
ncbi:MAG: ATP phosphoribosyltransferase regulatory subunit [Dehalococcoidia bacterium]|nr:ATP phosphoribosyltransferase regulatory subunit [Dehalococcoidia bacterium]